jgi:hypothetical protein
VSQELEGELVLLSLERAEYYGLNTTGTRVWHWLHDGVSLQTVAERLATAYHLDGAQACSDVLALAQALLDEGLASVDGGTSA